MIKHGSNKTRAVDKHVSQTCEEESWLSCMERNDASLSGMLPGAARRAWPSVFDNQLWSDRSASKQEIRAVPS